MKTMDSNTHTAFALFLDDKIVLRRDGRPIISSDANDLVRLGVSLVTDPSQSKTIRRIQISWSDDPSHIVKDFN